MRTIDTVYILLTLWTLSNQPPLTTPLLVNKDGVRIQVDEGDNVTMTCPFAKNLLDGSRLNFVWQRVIGPYSVVVVVNGSQSFVKRYRVEFSVEDSIFNLIILNVSLEDDNKFECEVTEKGSSAIIWHYSFVELQVFRKEEPPQWSKDRFVKVFEISDHLRINFLNETFRLRLVGPLPPSSYVEVKILGNSTGWTTSRLRPPPESDCQSAHLVIPAEDLRVRACIKQMNETTCSYFAQILYENGTTNNNRGIVLGEMDIISEPMKRHWIFFTIFLISGTLLSALSLYGLVYFLRRFEWGKLEEEKKEDSPTLRQWKCDQARVRAVFQREMKLAARRIAMQKRNEQESLVACGYDDMSWEEDEIKLKRDDQPETTYESSQESMIDDQKADQVIDMDDETHFSVVDGQETGQEDREEEFYVGQY